MRLNIFSPNINFQKRQIAKCTVLKDEKPLPCKISLLENTEEDKEYLKRTMNSPEWQGFHYLDIIEKSLDDNISKSYVLEDNNDNCLAICQIIKDGFRGKKFTNISLFESMPSRKKKKFNYLGETLINFIVQNTDDPNRDLIISCSVSSAKKFYRKCKFNDGKSKDFFDFIFDKQRLKKLKKQNQSHTGSFIEFIA